MLTKRVTLKDGPGWCKLRPLGGEEGFDRAQVVMGTIGIPGDVVQKPAESTWEEAARELTPDRTALSPFDLEIVLDRVTGHSYLPEGGLETLLQLSEDLAASEEFATSDDVAQQGILVRLIAALDEEPARRTPVRLRRRKADVA